MAKQSAQPASAATHTRIALFRGINVGRNKRVGMEELRKLFVKLGFRDVRTVLNSGNVVFTSAADEPREDAASRIEQALQKSLKVSSLVTLLDGSELRAVVRDNPLLDVADVPSRLMVAFMRDPTDRMRLAPLARRDWKPEALGLGKRVAYLWCPGGILASDLTEAVNAALGDAVTARNWGTVKRLEAMLE
jgi:uncharacterized protein (DUF1697 family)